MWIFLNNAFISVVEHRDDNSLLMVRARVAGDIERVFPSSEVLETPDADYRFRATISKKLVSAAIAKSIESINYDNFKNSVAEDWRHDAYVGVWSEMYQLQHSQQRRAA